MSFSLPRKSPLVEQTPPPQHSTLLRDAIELHRTKMQATADTRALTLTRLLMVVLGVQPDRMTYTPQHREPIAICDGLQFRGEALDPYSLEGGWLVVRTMHNGWAEVRSFEHLGQLALSTPLAILEAR